MWVCGVTRVCMLIRTKATHSSTHELKGSSLKLGGHTALCRTQPRRLSSLLCVLGVCKLTRDEKMREKSRVDLVRTLIEWRSLTSTKPFFQDPEMSQLSQDCGVELSQASALSISHLADTVEEPLSQVGNDRHGAERCGCFGRHAHLCG